MTAILDLLPPDHVFGGLRAASKADALGQLARRAAGALGIAEAPVLQVLLRRETLGSTAIGRGIAIPHAVLPGLERSFALFALAQTPIPFDAVDHQPVQAIFLLLTPEASAAESTRVLAHACRGLRDPAVLAALQRAADGATLYDTVVRLFRPRQAA